MRTEDQGRRQRGASGARLPHLKSAPLHFTFGPPVAAYIQYCIFKMWPSSGFWPPLLLNPGDGPAEDPAEEIHACSTNSSAKSKRFILQFPTVTPSLKRLWLSIQFLKTRALQIFGGRIAQAIAQQFEGRTSSVMRFFRHMLHSTKSTHFPQIHYVFIIGKMCFAAGWNGFAGRILARGP